MNQSLFYILLFVSTALIIVPIIISFFDDRNEKIKSNQNNQSLSFKREKTLLIVGLFGAFISFYNSCESHSESVKNAKEATYNDSLYKSLLKTNLDTTKHIIEIQNSTFDTLNRVLDSSVKILSLQNEFITLQNHSTEYLSNRIHILDSLQNELLLYQIGGVDTPRISFIPSLYTDDNYRLSIYLTNTGAYEINVQTTCYDLSYLRDEKLKNETINNPSTVGMLTEKKELSFNLMTNQGKEIFNKIIIPNKINYLYFNIKVRWNNKDVSAMVNLNVLDNKITFQMINYFDKDLKPIKDFK